MDRSISKLHNGLQLDGKVMTVGGVSCTVVLADANEMVLLAYGATVPTDAAAGFAKGAQFLKTGGGVATTLYINEGSSSSCDFNAMETSASSLTSLTAGLGLVGGGTEGAVTLNIGLSVRNATGGTLTKGTLVYVNGFDTGTGLPTIAKADGDAVLLATHVLAADLADVTSGTAYGIYTVTGLDTSTAGAVGDPVFLDTTAGGFTFSSSGGTGVTRQRVGTVVTKHASTGSILFYPMLAIVEAIGSASLQNGAVTLAKLGAGVTPVSLIISQGAVASAGGDATEVVSDAAINVGDTAIVWVQKAGTVPRTVDSWVITDNTLTVTLSGDPSTDHTIAYIVFRAAA